MKIIIKTIPSYDRVIKYVVEDNKIIYIDFLFGCDTETVDQLMKTDLKPNPIIDIYNRAIDQEQAIGLIGAKLKWKIMHAIELYCDAYIHQILKL